MFVWGRMQMPSRWQWGDVVQSSPKFRSRAEGRFIAESGHRWVASTAFAVGLATFHVRVGTLFDSVRVVCPASVVGLVSAAPYAVAAIPPLRSFDDGYMRTASPTDGSRRPLDPNTKWALDETRPLASTENQQRLGRTTSANSLALLLLMPPATFAGSRALNVPTAQLLEPLPTRSDNGAADCNFGDQRARRRADQRGRAGAALTWHAMLWIMRSHTCFVGSVASGHNRW